MLVTQTEGKDFKRLLCLRQGDQAGPPYISTAHHQTSAQPFLERCRYICLSRTAHSPTWDERHSPCQGHLDECWRRTLGHSRSGMLAPCRTECQLHTIFQRQCQSMIMKKRKKKNEVKRHTRHWNNIDPEGRTSQLRCHSACLVEVRDPRHLSC